jgi:hypothetical protein
VSTIKEKVTSDGAEKGDATRRIPLAEKSNVGKTNLQG